MGIGTDAMQAFLDSIKDLPTARAELADAINVLNAAKMDMDYAAEAARLAALENTP